MSVPPVRVRRAKLLRPVPGSEVVARPRLVARLNEGLDKPLTLVSGPAGSGKTTLLGEWLTSVTLPSAWLSLDEGDGNLTCFVEHLVSAMQSVGSGIGNSTLGLLRMADGPLAGDLATELGDDLLALDTDLILVLDDYHTVDDSEVDEFLTTLLRYPPPRLRLVLASRVDPFLPLAHLRTHGLLTEVRSSDLRFTDDETRLLFHGATSEHLDPATVDLLQERTEGWIAGLKLAALAIRDGGSLAALPRAEWSMQDYLTSEMVAGQPEDVQRFLLRTAVPERLCASLCDALLAPVSPSVSSQAMLERIERAGLFVMPLGEDRAWYRYHHLFRDLLLRRLVETEGVATLRMLHGQACTWFAGHDLIEDAIPHALASDRPAMAAEIIGNHLQRALAQRRWLTVEHWLSLLPPEQTAADPDLLLARAWVQRLRGQAAAMTITLDRAAALIARRSRSTDPGTVERWQAEADLLRWMFVPNAGTSVRVIHEAAMRAIASIPWESHAAASPALIPAATTQQMTGDTPGAIRLLTDALAECAGRSDPFALHHAQCASMGLMAVRLAAGDLKQFRLAAEELLTLSTAHGLGWGASAAHTYLGLHAYERDDLDNAISHLSAAVDEPEASSLILAHAFLGLAYAREKAGQQAAADATVNRYLDRLIATDAAAEIPTVRAFQARLALNRGDLAPALRWLRTSPAPQPGGAAHEFELPVLTRAKVLLAEASPASLAEADAILEEMLRHAGSVYSVPLRITTLAHQAVLRQAQGNRAAALATLGEALALAEPRGFFRTFVDLGSPMASLLARMLRSPDASPLAARLLDALQRPPTASLPVRSQSPTAPPPDESPLVEHLTERELEVLQGLVQRLSNKEIAEALFISPHTVKRHTASIYGKLGVSSRRQAVRRAVSLGLVPAGPRLLAIT